MRSRNFQEVLAEGVQAQITKAVQEILVEAVHAKTVSCYCGAKIDVSGDHTTDEVRETLHDHHTEAHDG